MKVTVEQKLKHLIKHFNFKREQLGEIEKMYSGCFFNPLDEAYLKLLELSKALCNRFNNMNGLMGKNPSIFKILRTLHKKNKLLDLLFIKHGAFSNVGENLSTVIGLVNFEGCGFMNRRVIFSQYCLVNVENYVMFGASVEIGDDKIEKKDNLIKLSTISIGANSWICAGVKVNNDVTIGEKCVIGAGAIVKNDILSNYLAIGRPCVEKKIITKDILNTSLINKIQQKNIDILKNHLKTLGFGKMGKEYLKLITGREFNSTNLKLARLYLFSHRLCSEYNAPQTSTKRKEEIIDILFPIKGENFRVGKNLFVDLLGSVVVGDNVCIGDGAILGGNISIGDNVKVGENVCLFATGHSLYYQNRKVGFSLNRGLYEITFSGFINIKSNLIIGNNVVVAPNTVIDKNIIDNCLVAQEKIIL